MDRYSRHESAEWSRGKAKEEYKTGADEGSGVEKISTFPPPPSQPSGPSRDCSADADATPAFHSSSGSGYRAKPVQQRRGRRGIGPSPYRTERAYLDRVDDLANKDVDQARNVALHLTECRAEAQDRATGL